MFELSYYPVINPKLSIESVLLLSLLSRCLSVLAMQYGLGAPVVCAQVCIHQPSPHRPQATSSTFTPLHQRWPQEEARHSYITRAFTLTAFQDGL
jgi:hypothetical protein